MTAETKPTHAGMVVFNLAGQVLLVSALGKDPTEWVFPKGHLEKGEESYEAAEREVREEAAINATVFGEPVCTTEFDYNGEHVVVEWWSGFAVGRSHAAYENGRELRWANWQEALQLLTYPDAKEVLRQALLHESY